MTCLDTDRKLSLKLGLRIGCGVTASHTALSPTGTKTVVCPRHAAALARHSYCLVRL